MGCGISVSTPISSDADDDDETKRNRYASLRKKSRVEFNKLSAGYERRREKSRKALIFETFSRTVFTELTTLEASGNAISCHFDGILICSVQCLGFVDAGAMGFFGEPLYDPFCILTVGDTTVKLPVVYASVDPLWDHLQLKFDMKSLMTTNLDIVLMNFNSRPNSDEVLGNASVPINYFIPNILTTCNECIDVNLTNSQFHHPQQHCVPGYIRIIYHFYKDDIVNVIPPCISTESIDIDFNVCRSTTPAMNSVIDIVPISAAIVVADEQIESISLSRVSTVMFGSDIPLDINPPYELYPTKSLSKISTVRWATDSKIDVSSNNENTISSLSRVSAIMFASDVSLDVDPLNELYPMKSISRKSTVRWTTDNIIDVSSNNENDPCLKISKPYRSHRTTMMHRAARSGNMEQYRAVLCNDDCDINVMDEILQTPLHIACSFDQVIFVHALLEMGASIDPIDALQWTPLHIAASINSIELCKLLVTYGAKTTNRNSENLRPCDVTAMHHVRQFLLPSELIAVTENEFDCPIKCVVNND